MDSVIILCRKITINEHPSDNQVVLKSSKTTIHYNICFKRDLLVGAECDGLLCVADGLWSLDI